jgi:hypothetical protein
MRLLSIILVAAVLLGAGTLPRATVTPGSWQGYCVLCGTVAAGCAVMVAFDKAMMRLSK